jgi:O-antigen ligase
MKSRASIFDEDMFRSVYAPLVGLTPMLMVPIRGFSIGRYTAAEIYLGLTIVACGVVLLGMGSFLGKLKSTTVHIMLWGGVFWLTLCAAVFMHNWLTSSSRLSSREIFSLAKPLGSIVWLAFLVEANWKKQSVILLFSLLGTTIYAATVWKWYDSGLPVPFSGFAFAKNDLGTGALATFLLAWMFSVREGFVHRLLCGVLLVLTGITLYATQSRASQGVVGLTLVFSILLLRVKYIGSGFALLIGFVQAATICVPFVYLHQLRSLGEGATLGGRDVFNGRHRLWQTLLDAIYDRPVFGHGDEFLIILNDGTELHAHNLTLAILYHGGLIAFTAFVAWQVAICALLCKKVRIGECRIALAAYLSFLWINQSFEPSLLYLHVTYFAFLPTIGIALSLVDADGNWRDRDRDLFDVV